jgi:transposase-like protein
MDSVTFDGFLNTISDLSPVQKEQLIEALQHSGDDQKVLDTIEALFTGSRRCIYCGTEAPYRHGSAHGLKRYRCRSCKRTYNALTNTPLARLRHKGVWLHYLRTLAQSATVRKAAERVGVHRNTAFRWRHRFLAWVKADQPETLEGIAEADEMFLRESQKGSRNLDRPPRKRGEKSTKPGLSREKICILVARDRSGQTADFVVGRGQVRQRDLLRSLGKVLDPDVLLLSDGCRAYGRFAQKVGITHEVVAGKTARGPFHIQNVNAYHSRFKGWLRRFHGVATKYLPNYMGWRRMLETKTDLSPERILQRALGHYEAAPV